MDKLETRNRPAWLPEPLPVLAPRALDMAGSFLLAWNPGAAAPSPFAVGYVCALPRDSSIYAAFGAFLGYLLTGARLGAAFGCALALCMTVHMLSAGSVEPRRSAYLYRGGTQRGQALLGLR